VCPVVPGSLDCPFLIATFSLRSGNQKRKIQRTRPHRAHKTKKWQSKTDNPENPAQQGTQDEEVAIKNGQSREPGTTGHTRRRSGNQKRTIQRTLLRLVCPVVQSSLDCPFLIVTSSFCVPCGAEFSGLSVFDCHFFVLCALWCRVLWIVRF
jgi:hypothetical protein